MKKASVAKVLGIIFEVLGILSPFAAAYFEQAEQEKELDARVRQIIAEEKAKESENNDV